MLQLVTFEDGESDIFDPEDNWDQGTVAEMVNDHGDIESSVSIELLCSFDHGLRTADELALCVGTECAGRVMTAVYVFAGLRVFDVITAVDWDTAFFEATGIDYSGDGWMDPVGDMSSDWLYEWCDEMMYAASDAGLMIVQNGDAGMTWFYGKVI